MPISTIKSCSCIASPILLRHFKESCPPSRTLVVKKGCHITHSFPLFMSSPREGLYCTSIVDSEPVKSVQRPQRFCKTFWWCVLGKITGWKSIQQAAARTGCEGSLSSKFIADPCWVICKSSCPKKTNLGQATTWEETWDEKLAKHWQCVEIVSWSLHTIASNCWGKCMWVHGTVPSSLDMWQVRQNLLLNMVLKQGIWARTMARLYDGGH